MSFVALITCSAVFAMVSCYPSGPPSSACTTLTPNHPASTGSGAAPYELTVNPTTYGPGDQIIVTISKTGAEDFRGIIVQARSKTGGSTAAVGTFSSPSSGTKLLFCGDTDNTWAHSDRTDKSSVTSTWTAPSSGGEDLVFHYSIVQKNDDNSGSVFYTGLMTDLPLMEVPNNSTTMALTTEATTEPNNSTTVTSTTESKAVYHRASLGTTAMFLFAITIFKQLI